MRTFLTIFLISFQPTLDILFRNNRPINLFDISMFLYKYVPNTDKNCLKGFNYGNYGAALSERIINNDF